MYFNTMSDLAYIDSGLRISLSEYPNHFVMVFKVTSTQQASHDFIHPVLTNCSISIELKFSAALPGNTQIFIIGEKLALFSLTLLGELQKIVFLQSDG